MGSENRSELISIGLVRKPIGLTGWMGVTAYGATMEELKLPCDVMVGKVHPERIETCRVVAFEHHSKGYRVKFDGIDTLEQAEAFRNAELMIQEDRLPVVDEDEFYHFELVGLEVLVDQTNQSIGKVKAVHNYPSVDALEISRNDSQEVFLVPFTPEAVKEINREKRSITLDESVLEDIL